MRKGFTLIELLIAMAVMGILIAVSIPSFNNMQDMAKRAKAKNDIKLIQTAVEAHNAFYGHYPTQLASLESHGVIIRKLPNDPWKGEGSTYQYAMTDIGYEDGTVRYHYAIWTTGTNQYSDLLDDNDNPALPSTAIGATNLPRTHPLYPILFAGEWF